MSKKNPRRDNEFFALLRKPQIIRQDSKWIGGVAAGVAQRFNIDVVLVRGILVALSVLGGLGLVLYGLAWIMLPDTQDQIHLEQAFASNWTTGMTGGVITVILGIFPAGWFLDSVAPVLWPVAIVGAVLFIIFRRRNTKYEGASAPAPTVTGNTVEKPWRSDTQNFSAQADLGPEQTTSWATDQMSPEASPKETPMSADKPESSGGFDATHHLDPNFAQPYPSETLGTKAKASRPRPAPAIPGWAATTVLGLTVMVIALVLSLDYLKVLDLPGSGWSVALACALLVVGLAMVIAATAKRTSGGLLGMAIPLLVLTVIFGGSNWASTERGPLHFTDNGTNIDAVFSNSTIDLTDRSTITSDTTVEVDAVFSNIDFIFPSNIPVKFTSDGVFNSGLDGPVPQNSQTFPSGTPTLTIEVDGAFSNFESSVVDPGSLRSTPSF